MTDTFHPTLLVSMPQLQDPNFARTVVLLCDFLPEGAFGLVLNRPTDAAASSMVRLDPPVEHGNNLPLSTGGPVEPDRGWILVGEEPPDVECRTIVEGLYLSTSPVLLRRVLESSPSSARARPRGLRGLGPRSARRRTGAVRVAHVRHRARYRVRHGSFADVGDRDSPDGRGSVGVTDEPWGSLTVDSRFGTRAARSAPTSGPRQKNQSRADPWTVPARTSPACAPRGWRWCARP